MGAGLVPIIVAAPWIPYLRRMTSTLPRIRPQDIAGLSGREILQHILDGRLPPPSMARTLGMRLVAVGDGSATFEGETGEHLLNPAGTVHGGWALALIDSATGCAAQSVLPPDTAYTTIETKANFSRPIFAETGRVRAEGKVVSAGRTIISCEASVRDADGRLLAHGTSTLMVLANRR